MVIRFIRFDDRAQIPKRKYVSDTGADIYMLDGGFIKPHQTVVIPLGFGIEVPNGHSARLQVRTSVAKKGIIVQGCAIDAGFDGEISMILHNVSDDVFTWDKNDRLCYIEVYPTQYPEFAEFMPPSRGQGKFGSTGR